MKQGEAARFSLDLDDLERQLSAAAGPRRSGSDDPLAELARIVGYGDQATGRAPARPTDSFDDFLVNPPRSVTEMMGAPPSRAPSLPSLPQAAAPVDDGLFDAAVKPSAPAAKEQEPALERWSQAVAPAAAPASEMTPASLQEQLAAALGEPAPRLRPALPMEEVAAIGPSAALAPSAEPADAMSLERQADAAAAPARHGDPRFEEMLREFDAAMRDVGAQPLQAPPVAALAPEMRVAPVVPSTLAYDPEAELPAAPPPAHAGRSRFGMVLAGGVIGVALVGAAGLLAFGGGSKNAGGGSAPVIAAKPGVTKERPANPGGVEVPNQDKEILSRTPAPPQAERVAPREEQPVDLTQAQRSADPQASAGVRQIPGVLVVGPSSTQPAGSPGATPATPPMAQPRPVASVPITIAGQPAPEAPAAVPSTPTVAAAPVASRPVAAVPTVPAAPVAPAAPAAAAAAPAQPAPAAGQVASAEPRRVRAVPIRPDEGAPNRAQGQPRVVPAAPARQAPAAAAEADDSNAPLRITPQAVRSAPSSRAAAVAPATVPGSTGAPVTTQSTSPDAAPSGGGSFAVQIGAEGSQDAAQARFNRMRSQHSGVLGGLSPTIRSAEVNGRSVYRVRVGQMSREEAVSLCERLKADGGSCFVARN